MSIADRNKLSELEQRLVQVEQRLEGAIQQVNELSAAREALKQMRVSVPESKPSQKMCPKCNEKPAYFFHVRSCSGPRT